MRQTSGSFFPYSMIRKIRFVNIRLLPMRSLAYIIVSELL